MTPGTEAKAKSNNKNKTENCRYEKFQKNFLGSLSLKIGTCSRPLPYIIYGLIIGYESDSHLTGF